MEEINTMFPDFHDAMREKIGFCVDDIIAYYLADEDRGWEYAVQLNEQEVLLVLSAPVNMFLRVSFPTRVTGDANIQLSGWLMSEVPSQSWLATFVHEVEHVERAPDVVYQVTLDSLFLEGERKELVSLPVVGGNAKGVRRSVRAVDIFLSKTHVLANRVRARFESRQIVTRAPGLMIHSCVRSMNDVRMEGTWHGHKTEFLLKQSGEAILTIGEYVSDSTESVNDWWHYGSGYSGSSGVSSSGSSLFPLWEGKLTYSEENCLRRIFQHYKEETCLHISGEELADVFCETVVVLTTAPYQYAFFAVDNDLDQELEGIDDDEERALLVAQRRKQVKRVYAHEAQEAIQLVHEQNPDMVFRGPLSSDTRVFPLNPPVFAVLV